MILCEKNLNQRMPVGVQENEINRLRNAKIGDVLFTAYTCQDTDVIDTLLYKSGIQYKEGVAGYKVTYYKN